jgi:hypothetical protein
MILEYIIIVSGFVFAFRMRDEFVDRQKLIVQSLMTKIGTAYFAFAFAMMMFAHSSLLIWMSVFVPQFLFFTSMSWLKNQRRSGFREIFMSSLTRLILKMKAGRAFRQALNEIIEEVEPQMRASLVEIRDFVIFSQHEPSTHMSSPILESIVNEFRLADQSPHAALRRLLVFREKIHTENDFRRRSGQVLRQIRAQSLLLGGLYLAVLAFVSHQFGAMKHIQIIFASIFLFSVGQFWIWWGGRNWKWKV